MELDTQRARKINKFTGISMVIMGVLSLVSMFLPPIFAVVWVILIILYSVVCIVYAMVVARK